MTNEWEQERQKLTKSIKVHDQVWIMQSGHRMALKTVTRLTPTLIIMGEGGEYDRYKRSNGYAWRKYGRDYIEKVATPEEIKQWEEKKAAERKIHEEREARETRREAKLKELNTEFSSEQFSIRSHDYQEGRFDIEVYDQDEATTRKIAEAVSRILKGAR